jgi:UDP-glucose-4-epimerase GalE
MAIVVVGGAGYIGSHTARALRRRGYEVIIFDNLSTGHRILADGFELIEGDIADEGKVTQVMRRADAVMHFAAHAYVGESVENPRKYFQNNVTAGLTLLNAALDTGVRNFVFSSTCAVYGAPLTLPIAENTPREPVNPYGATKLFFENALEAYARAYGLSYAALRYFNAAGADESGEIGELHDPETHLIPLALTAASETGPELQVYGSDHPTPDGTCIRDYVHVNDIAEAHVLAVQHLLSGEKSVTLNLGTGEGFSVKQVLACVHRVTGRGVRWRGAPRRNGDPPSLVADPSRAHQVLGWRPKRGLEEIVSTAWDWMKLGRAASLRRS